MVETFSSDHERTILASIVLTLQSIPAIGRVIPAPIYFGDSAEYWSTYEESDLDTQDELDLANIRFASVYLKTFVDSADSPLHSPRTEWQYEFYLFNQYDAERESESLLGDALQRRMLKNHAEFIEGIIELKAAYQGTQSIPGLDPTDFVMAETRPLSVLEEIQNRAQCEFIPGVVGSTMRLRLTAMTQLRAC